MCVCLRVCVWVARIGWHLVAKQGCRTQWISKILLLYNLLCHTYCYYILAAVYVRLFESEHVLEIGHGITWDNILSLNLSALNRPNSSGPKGRSLRSRLKTCKVPSWVEIGFLGPVVQAHPMYIYMYLLWELVRKGPCQATCWDVQDLHYSLG